MAIKEFQIGPLNYFEEGYLSGDYTQPNISKAFLQCDVDNVKGGVVQTGEYFLDNYIDGTYFHNNSLKISLSVTANKIKSASVSLRDYFEEDYFVDEYVKSSGSVFVVAVSLTQVISSSITISSQASVSNIITKISDAASSIISSAQASIQAGKIVNSQTTMSSEFSQTTYGSKTLGIDMFAFTDGAIAAQVNAIRDTNTQASTYFDIATDYVRYRATASDVAGEFLQSVAFGRNRDTSLETQVAFSFDINNYRIRDNDSQLSLSASLSSGIEITKPGSADLASTSSVFCVISHIHGADLQAFSEGQVQAQAQATLSGSVAANAQVDTFIDGDAIRDAIVSATTTASISVDVLVFRGFVVEQTSTFVAVNQSNIIAGAESHNNIQIDLTATISNYRGVDMVAFDTATLTANAVVNRDAQSNVISVASQEVSYIRYRDNNVQSDIVASQDTNNIRIRYFNISANAVCDLTAEVRAIKDAHLTSFDAVTLSCSISVTRDSITSLQASSGISLLGGKLTQYQSQITSHFYVFVSRRIRKTSERPLDLVDNFINGQPSFDTNIKKFGTASYSGGAVIGKFATKTVPTATEDFYWEGWLYPKGNTGYIFSTTYWLYIDILSNQRFRIAFQLPVSSNSYPSLGYIYTGANNTLSLNTWHHIAIVKTYTSMSYYIDGVRVYNITDTNIPNGFYGPDNGNFWGTYTGYDPYQSIFMSAGAANVDEVFYVRNSTFGYNPNATTISVPTSPRINGDNVQALWHFDNNVFDDLSLTFVSGANLQSSSSVVSRLTANYSPTLALSSSSSLTAVIGKLQEINLVAFDDVEVTAIPLRIQQSSVNVSTEISVDANINYISDTTAPLTSTSNILTLGDRIRFGVANSASTISANININKVGNGVASATASFALIAVIGKLEEIVLEAFTNNSLTSDVNVIAGGLGTFNSNSFVESIAVKSTDVTASILTASSQSTIATRVYEVSSNLQSQSSVNVDATHYIGIIQDLSSEVYTNKPYAETDYVDTDYATNFETIANYIVDNQQNLNVVTTLTADVDYTTNITSMVMSSGDLTADVNVVRGANVSSFVEFSQSIAVGKITDVISNIESAFTLQAQGIKGGDIELVAFTNADVTANVERIRYGNSAVNSLITVVVNTFDSLNANAQSIQSAAFSQSTTGYRVRTAVIHTDSIAISLSVGVKETDTSANLSATTTLNVSISKVSNSGAILSASTSQVTNASKQVAGVIYIGSAMVFVSQVREIRIDEIEYKIPAEDWTFNILPETRFFGINGETRLRKITQETAIRKIAEESRIYIIE